MKKRSAFIPCLLILVAIAFFAACPAPSHAENVDDLTLAANVKSALEADDTLGAFGIGIETRDGVVILTGWVRSEAAVQKAGQIAGNTKGTRKVENKLTVR